MTEYRKSQLRIDMEKIMQDQINKYEKKLQEQKTMYEKLLRDQKIMYEQRLQQNKSEANKTIKYLKSLLWSDDETHYKFEFLV